MKKLGLKACGGNYSTINNYINKYKIDTSHWKRQAHNKNKQFKSFNNYKTKTAIKKHILRLRGAICESCKLEQCLNKPIKLELHHIDGNNQNNVEENLQLLCPNCHSFTDTWRKSYTR